MPKRTVFFVSDETGVTAETLGRTLLTQFDQLEFRSVTLPFVSTPEKAREAARAIDEAAQADGQRPLVFATLVADEVRDIVLGADGFALDFFDAFLGPLETELAMASAHASGRAHGMSNASEYYYRIDATNFALAHDDGMRASEYDEADVVLIGVSRSGKTPTCLYLALQYAVFAANAPLTEDHLQAGQLPESLRPHQGKLFALTIAPERLLQIREERLPGSRYASPAQVRWEIEAAERLLGELGILLLDTTHSSIEEIASTILSRTGLKRRAWT